MSRLKWTYEACKEEALKYNNLTQFRKNNSVVYGVCVKRKWLADLCSHMQRTLKPKGYWTKERCLEIASNYKYSMDFYKENREVYAACFRGGWLEEVTSKFDKKCSNILRFIYAYEFPDNNVYIGLTYNLEERANGHRKEGTVYNYSCKTGFIAEMKQLIIEPVSPEEASYLEEYYISVYKDNGWNILNKIKPGGLGGMVRKWTKDKCIDVISKYTDKTHFIKNKPKVYDALIRNRWFDELCSHLKTNKKHNSYWTLEKCLEVAKTCNSRKEFETKYSSAHSIVYRNGWKDIVFKHMGIKRHSNEVI